MDDQGGYKTPPNPDTGSDDEGNDCDDSSGGLIGLIGVSLDTTTGPKGLIPN